MSLFSWFFRKLPKKASQAHESSGLGHLDETVPGIPSAIKLKSRGPSLAGDEADRKTERRARREQLYGVVRESMERAGVLSTSYKFKVLSLDPRGRQYMIMMDLAHEFAGDTGWLAEVEAMIAQSAKARHDIFVTAVYWRVKEHVTAGLSRYRPGSGVSESLPPEQPKSTADESVPQARYAPREEAS